MVEEEPLMKGSAVPYAERDICERAGRGLGASTLDEFMASKLLIAKWKART